MKFIKLLIIRIQARLTRGTNDQNPRDWSQAIDDQVTASYQSPQSFQSEMGSSILKGARR